eukprot:UN11596
MYVQTLSIFAIITLFNVIFVVYFPLYRNKFKSIHMLLNTYLTYVKLQIIT